MHRCTLHTLLYDAVEIDDSHRKVCGQYYDNISLITSFAEPKESLRSQKKFPLLAGGNHTHEQSNRNDGIGKNR